MKIENQRNMYKAQKRHMIEKAQRMANMTYGMVARSCNKLMIGKVFWKSLALPSILYGANAFIITDVEMEKLEKNRKWCIQANAWCPKIHCQMCFEGRSWSINDENKDH